MSTFDESGQDFPEVVVFKHLCEQFAEITETDIDCAKYYLQSRQWDLDKSINDFFENSTVTAIEADDRNEAAVIVIASRSNQTISNRQISNKRQCQTPPILDSREKKKRKIECSVCMDDPEEMSVSGRNLVSTICGHIFCNACLKNAIKSSSKCPQCRKRLNEKQYHPLFI